MRYIESKRLILKEELKRSQIRKLYGWYTYDPETIKYTAYANEKYKDANELWDFFQSIKHQSIILSINVKGHLTNKYIGQFSIYSIHPKRTCDIGIYIARKYWGGGIGTETKLLGLGFAFEALGVKKIYTNVHEKNKANIHINENKFGFKRYYPLHRPKTRTCPTGPKGEQEECKLVHFVITKEEFQKTKKRYQDKDLFLIRSKNCK